MQQRRLTLVIVFLALAIGVPPPMTAGAKEADAGAFLQALSRDASARLGRVDLSAAEKEANFRQLFRSAFDVPAISRFVLGKFWRRASEDQRRDFMAAFEELHMRRFLPLFAKFDAESFTVESVVSDDKKPNFFRVSSRVIRPESEPISLVWRVRDTGEAYKVLDIVAEGVSMAISLRHEYGTVAKARGLDNLLQEMRKKSAELALE